MSKVVVLALLLLFFFVGSFLSTASAFRLDVDTIEEEVDASHAAVNNKESIDFFKAVEAGNVEAAKALLDAKSAKVNDKNAKAVSIAAKRGDMKMLEMLLTFKPDLNWPDREEKSALPALTAALNGHLEAAELLLSHGASLDSSNEDGTILYKFYNEKAPSGFFGPNPSAAIVNTLALFEVIKSKKADKIEDLMKKPILVDALLEKESILTTAAQVGCLPCLKTLIEKCNVNPDQENQDGETAIFTAQRAMKARCLIYLHDKCDPWHKDKGGLTLVDSMQQPHYVDESDIPW